MIPIFDLTVINYFQRVLWLSEFFGDLFSFYRLLICTQFSKSDDFYYQLLCFGLQIFDIIKNSNIIMFDSNSVVLSYASQKANNLCELQIVDLQETILQKQKNLGLNQVKQLVSKIYNIYCETEDVYKQLRAPFLYQQNRKLLNCLGIIFLSLVEKAEKKNSAVASIVSPNTLTFYSSQISQRSNQFKKTLSNISKIKTKKTIQNEIRKQAKSIDGNQCSKPRRFGGVYIYNQDIKRNIESLKINDKQKPKKKKNLTQEDIKDEKRKFMQEILEMATGVDRQYLQPDQVARYLSEKKSVTQKLKHMQFSDELEKIAIFFKTSQNDALQFLKNSKDHNSMLEFTQSFHRIIEQYKSSKNVYVQAITKKVVEALEMIKAKYGDLKKFHEQKQNQILELSNKHKKKLVTIQTQTTQDLTELIKKLELTISHLKDDYNILKNYMSKQIQGEVKNLGNAGMDIKIKEQKIKKLEQTLSQKNGVIQKLQMKIKICQSNLKNVKRESFMKLDMNTKTDIISQIFDESKHYQNSNGDLIPIHILKPRQSNSQNDDKISEISSHTEQNTRFNKKRMLKKISNYQQTKKISTSKNSQRKQSILLSLPQSIQIPKKRRMSKKIEGNIIEQESQRNMNSEISVISRRNIKTTQKKSSLALHNKNQQNISRKNILQDQNEGSYKSNIMKKTIKGGVQLNKSQIQKQAISVQNKSSSKKRQLSPQEKKISLRETKHNKFSNKKFRKSSNHNSQTKQIYQQKSQETNLKEKVNAQNDKRMTKKRKQRERINKKVDNSEKLQKDQCRQDQEATDNYDQKQATDKNDQKEATCSNDQREATDNNYQNNEQLNQESYEDQYNEQDQKYQQNFDEQVSSYKSGQQHGQQEEDQCWFEGQICPQFSITLQFKNQRKPTNQTNRASLDSCKSGSNLFSNFKDKKNFKNLKKPVKIPSNSANGNFRNQKQFTKTVPQSLPKVFKPISDETQKQSSTTILKRQSIAKRKTGSNFCLPSNKNQFAADVNYLNRKTGTIPDQQAHFNLSQAPKNDLVSKKLFNASIDEDSILNLFDFDQQKNKISVMELQAIKIAKKSKNVQQFIKKIRKIHRTNCGQNCIHLKRYIQNFQKYQNQTHNQTRQIMKIHIQNLNQSSFDYQHNKESQKHAISTQKILSSFDKNK